MYKLKGIQQNPLARTYKRVHIFQIVHSTHQKVVYHSSKNILEHILYATLKFITKIYVLETCMGGWVCSWVGYSWYIIRLLPSSECIKMKHSLYNLFEFMFIAYIVFPNYAKWLFKCSNFSAPPHPPQSYINLIYYSYIAASALRVGR